MCGGGGGCGGILSGIGTLFGGPLGGLFTNLISSVLMPTDKPKIPVPAAPAPAARATGGATVQIGTDTANSRVSGPRPGSSRSSTSVTDPLAGLGRGGLSL